MLMQQPETEPVVEPVRCKRCETIIPLMKEYYPTCRVLEPSEYSVEPA